MVDFLQCLVSTVTIFSSTILSWLKKAAMFEFCRLNSYMLPRRLCQLDEMSSWLYIGYVTDYLHLRNHASWMEVCMLPRRLRWLDELLIQRQDIPIPGIIARQVSTRPILAFSATCKRNIIRNVQEGLYTSHLPATLMSAVRAISSPPPKATPSMAAITGIGSSPNSLATLLALPTSLPTSDSWIFVLSFRSAPSQKVPGTSLFRMTTLTSRLSLTVWIASSNWWAIYHELLL